MNDKKNCMVLYYKSTESWLDKIPENINVLKKIELNEGDTIENINEKIKDNFCVNSSGTNIEVIIFLSCYEKNNVERLFHQNNFALFLPVIIEVNNENKLDKMVNKLNDVVEIININKKNYNLTSSYFFVLKEFKSFFDKIHRNCIGKCEIKKIDNHYEDYKDLPENDVKNILKHIQSINNIFGFFSIMDKDKFIFSLEYAFKYNIMNRANIIINSHHILPSAYFNPQDIADYILKINEYYKLSEKDKETIIEAILSKKLIRI